MRPPDSRPLLGLLLGCCCLVERATSAAAAPPTVQQLGANGTRHTANGGGPTLARRAADKLIEIQQLPDQYSQHLASGSGEPRAETATSSPPADQKPEDKEAAANQTLATPSAANLSDIVELSAFEAARLGYFRHSPLTSVTLTVAYTIVFVIGIVGNSFVVAIVCKSPRMRTVTNYFIVNLAFADILVLLFCLPATLIGNLFIPYVLGLFVCKTVSYLQGIAVGASINTMVTVTLDRFLAICFPLDWHMSRRTARWVIACIWLFSALISAPWAVYFTLVPYPLDSITIQVCAEDWPSERLGTLYFVCANLILLYLFPATVIILCYLGIWYKIERRNIPGDRPQGLKIELIMQKSKIKVIKMMMFVVVIFLLSWAPLYLIFTRIKLASERSQWEDWLITKMMPLAQWLGASNSCINPVLYTFFNRKYKRGFFDLFRFAFCCDPSMRHERQAQAKALTTNGTEFVRLDGSLGAWHFGGTQNNHQHQQHRLNNQSFERSNSTRRTCSNYSAAERAISSAGNQSKGAAGRQIAFRGGDVGGGAGAGARTSPVGAKRALSVQTLASGSQTPTTRRPAAQRGDAAGATSSATTSCSSSSSVGHNLGSRLTGRRLSAGLPSLGNNSSMATTTTTIEEEEDAGQALFGAGPISDCQSISNIATTSMDCDDLRDDDDDDDEEDEHDDKQSGDQSESQPDGQQSDDGSEAPNRCPANKGAACRAKVGGRAAELARRPEMISRPGDNNGATHAAKTLNLAHCSAAEPENNQNDRERPADRGRPRPGGGSTAGGCELRQLGRRPADNGGGSRDSAGSHIADEHGRPGARQVGHNQFAGGTSDANLARPTDEPGAPEDADYDETAAGNAVGEGATNDVDIETVGQRRRRRRRRKQGPLSKPGCVGSQLYESVTSDSEHPGDLFGNGTKMRDLPQLDVTLMPDGGSLVGPAPLPGERDICWREAPRRDRFELDSGDFASASLADLFLRFLNGGCGGGGVDCSKKSHDGRVDSARSQGQLASNHAPICDNNKSPGSLTASKSCVDLSKRRNNNHRRHKRNSGFLLAHRHQQHYVKHN